MFRAGRRCLQSVTKKPDGFFSAFSVGGGAFRWEKETGEQVLEKRIGVIGIVVEDLESAEQINALLHEYSYLLVGRMGIPYRQKGISIIAVVVDGNQDDISALTGKLGRIQHVSVKTALAKNA